MAVPSSPLPVLRFAGLLAGNGEELAAARSELARRYGTIDDESEIIPFSLTHYYDDQMGPNLLRQWVRFSTLSLPEQLIKWKLETNEDETVLARQFNRGVPRPVNIDPGYVARYKVILASTKDHLHRVYLGDGIYGEVALHWGNNKWEPWPWSYADYQTPAATAFFERARAVYLDQIQHVAAGR
jgi:hypothetical protein